VVQERSETIALVVNPRSTAGRAAPIWDRASGELRRRGTVRGAVETAADGANVERIRCMIGRLRPALIVAAGGDGTVSETAHAIAQTPPANAPALAILPLGTANNVARSLGLESLRRRDKPALDLALRAIFGGGARRIDVGAVGERYFVGSLAIGMDADILATRNRLRHRFALNGTVGGYTLYLWSCAVNVLRRHGTRARLRADGAERTSFIFNLLVTNTPLYAGEFRFDAANSCDDGRLDLHLFGGRADYLRRYPAAWVRHLRFSRGVPVAAPARIERIRELTVDLDEPLAAQLDGEELLPSASYRVRAVPAALEVRLPMGRE
jgi:diacylglycerol kinase (ATP)